MKKLLLILFLPLLLVSCSSTQSTSEAGPSKKTMKGTWEVVSVELIGNGVSQSPDLFNMAEASCFKNSKWVFVPNNGSGKYSIDSRAECEPVATRIHWSFYEPGDGSYQFQFKYVDENNKPIDSTNRGYSAKLSYVSTTEMNMRVTVVQNGESVDVLLGFRKISDELTV